MFKKIFAAILSAFVIMSISACSVENGKENSVASTEKETVIFNNFGYALPNFEFDNEISEDYEEGVKYSFNVKCSKKECAKYIEELKKAGFTERATETKNYYTAVSEDGYFVEMTYINGNLTVYTKKIA